MSKARRINAQDFAEKFVEGEVFEKYSDQAYRQGGFNTNLALGLMLDEADIKGLDLVNLDLFDSENFFHDAHDQLQEVS